MKANHITFDRIRKSPYKPTYNYFSSKNDPGNPVRVLSEESRDYVRNARKFR